MKTAFPFNFVAYATAAKRTNADCLIGAVSLHAGQAVRLNHREACECRFLRQLLLNGLCGKEIAFDFQLVDFRDDLRRFLVAADPCNLRKCASDERSGYDSAVYSVVQRSFPCVKKIAFGNEAFLLENEFF